MTKRGRGLLEADVKQITDAYVMGEFEVPDGKPLTAYRIATAIKERDSLDELPTVGGVVYVLQRWERIGFATFTHAPYAFDDYTEEGREIGLAALGRRDKEARKAERKAAKEAEAKADQREQASDDTQEISVHDHAVGVEEDPAGADAQAADDEPGPFDEEVSNETVGA